MGVREEERECRPKCAWALDWVSSVRLGQTSAARALFTLCLTTVNNNNKNNRRKNSTHSDLATVKETATRRWNVEHKFFGLVDESVEFLERVAYDLFEEIFDSHLALC